MITALRLKSTIATASEKQRKGAEIRYRLIPQLRMAVISRFFERRPNVRSVAIRIASGAI